MLTGESLPVEKQAGATVMGGTLNKTGAFRFRATRVGSDTALAQIIRLVEDAQASKAPIQRLAHWVTGHFILGVHVLALAVFAFWFLVGYQRFFDPASAFILSPGALGAIGVFGFALLLSITVLAMPLVGPRVVPTPPPAPTADRGGMTGLAFVVRLCTLPLVVLLAAPRLGAAGAAGVAVAVLAVVVLGCWVLCAWSRVRWHRAEGDVR